MGLKNFLNKIANTGNFREENIIKPLADLHAENEIKLLEDQGIKVSEGNTTLIRNAALRKEQEEDKKVFGESSEAKG